jgi:hypothetical protein
VLSFICIGIYCNNHHRMLQACEQANGAVFSTAIFGTKDKSEAAPEQARWPHRESAALIDTFKGTASEATSQPRPNASIGTSEGTP